ncbi:FecR family protein [Mucilaginibacter sp.]|uniref:FecR family protein n=1 Tax=Mucilaginibacter sp. TaxID=1882438 RepID=UPI003AFF8E24
MPDHRFDQLFNLYTQNKATEAEIAELFALFRELPTENQLNHAFFSLWEKTGPEENIQQPDWRQLYQQTTGTSALQANAQKTKRLPSAWYYAAAAVFTGVFLVILFSVLHQPKQREMYITYTVPYTTTKTLVFADGSKAVLNAGTTIKYPKTFNGKTREVTLDGEAFFQVVHLRNKPFIVHSGRLQTQVLGTSFNVDAYARSASMKVTVVTGKVAVKEASGGRQLMLTSNQEAVLNTVKSSFKKVLIADAENKIAWQDGKLVFEDAPLDEVASQLSLKFGVQTTLSNPQLKNCRISAVFQHKQLAQILTVITKLTNSGFSLQGNKAVISGKGCN